MAIKMKRGTTQSWSLGPELVHFENSSAKDKDSVIRAEGTDLQMYVYTESANEWYTGNPMGGNQTDGKIPGLPINLSLHINYDNTKHYRLQVDYSGPNDCALEMIGWGGLLIQHDFTSGVYLDEDYYYSGPPSLFMKWPAEQVGVAEPTPVTIRVSMREIDAYGELEEGQLGLEYTDDGQAKLKAGMPGINKWNELPYISAHDHFYVVSPSGVINVFNYWTIQTVIGSMDFQAWCNSDLNVFGFTYDETGVYDPNGDPLYFTRDEAINGGNLILSSNIIQPYHTYYTG